ncbi:MAG: MBL fold metallo-hydrolase [Cytophaga sp.]|uniref:MBL fold metallo-hydrolase n=1 Tax=Cytophaga sp. TaxID=29535 RepID=UPI003F81E6BE
MKLFAINAGNFKLDGGAMFGVVPKSIWNKLNPADANNLCTWATRCLLIENGKQLVLIDTGLGDKQDESFFRHYYRDAYQTWDQLLAPYGYQTSDVTDVFLTHLHFDHVGAALERQSGKIIPTFKNARYWSNEKHWQWAIQPNPREKASFLKENLLPLQESGQLHFITLSTSPFDWMEVICVDGHTEQQMLPLISTPKGKLLYAADLLPSAGHVPMPYIMSYDVRPLLSMQEKDNLFQRALAEKWSIFLEHDPVNECIDLQMTEKGVRLSTVLQVSDFN